MVVRRTVNANTPPGYELADSSKLGTIAVHRVCPLDRITAVITDDETDDEAEPGAHEALSSAGVTVLRASDTEREGLSEAG